MPKPCQVGTIRKVHQRLLDEGFLISEYTLRQWVKTGILPAVFVGNKALISFSNVTAILSHDLPLNSAEHQPSSPSFGA